MQKMYNFKELRQQLVDEQIKDILLQYNVEPTRENENEIVFPTCCHNLEGGSPKLHYYKDSKLFHCFTECASTFDIFTLLQKMNRLRGREISLKQAVAICGLDSEGISAEEFQASCFDEIRYMQGLNDIYIPRIEDLKFKVYDTRILRDFSFDYIGLMPWIQEGIGIEALQKFNIRYDKFKDAIIIPNFDYNGNLIGVRARYMRPEDAAFGKYRPVYDPKTETVYSHPTGRTFYGIFENKSAIERKKTVVIFEGEKSVLHYDTIYGSSENISLASLGQNITKDHIQYLQKMGVRHVILAYDTDYEDYKELADVEQKYIEKGKILSPYFNVSILMDYEFDLDYKSSPIDGGKEIFEKIVRNRRII